MLCACKSNNWVCLNPKFDVNVCYSRGFLEIKVEQAHHFRNSDTTGNISSFVYFYSGTVVLWVCWPSFNAILVEGVARHRAIVNTYYAIVTSCVTSCAFSSLLTKESKLSMVSDVFIHKQATQELHFPCDLALSI